MAIIMVCATLQAAAQTMYVCQPGKCTAVKSADAGDMTFSNGGQNFTIAGTMYTVGSIDSVAFSKPEMTVYITMASGSATVDNRTGGLVTVISNSRGHVALKSAADADEINYVISGSGSDNSLYIEGDYKLTLTLAGVQITNPDSAAIRVKSGKLVNLVIADGTTNKLTDAKTNDNIDACLWIKGHAEISGAGTLTLTGNNKHAFKSGEYCTLKSDFAGTITVSAAVSDAWHCSDYFEMDGGNMSLNATGDGVQVDSLVTDGKNVSAGYIVVAGGTLTDNISSSDVAGMKCDGAMTQSGGAITVNIASTALSADGIKIGGSGTMSGGSYTATVAANGSRGITGDANYTMAGGTMTMTVSGGKDKVTDPTDARSCFGVKLDGTWKKTGGTVAISITSDVKAAIKDANNTYGANGE
jgi:hypothetical protein